MTLAHGKPVSLVARTHFDLEVHAKAFNLAMDIFEMSKDFPRVEQFALTDQIRRSSRAVTANIAEAWARRRYEASFVQRLTDAVAELYETQEWLAYGVACACIDETAGKNCMVAYEEVAKTLNAMIKHSTSWCRSEIGFKPSKRSWQE